MKRIVVILALVMTLSLLVGCGIGGGGEIPNYNADATPIAPEDIELEHFTPDTDETYYTSEGLSLYLSVKGAFFKMDVFTLDGDKRIYDNVYLYEGDYLYAVTDDVKYLYAALKDTVSPEYAEVERSEGEDVQININKDGIYTVVFDAATLEFELIYKSEITEPVLYTIKNCSIYSLASSWVEMQISTENEDEFVIRDFYIAEGELISFFDRLHVSNYIVTLDDGIEGRYAEVRNANVFMMIGGKYDVYINRRTYEVRLELSDPDTAEYTVVFYNGEDFITLEPYDEAEPHIFRMSYTVDTKYTTDVPSFYSASYMEYELTVLKSDLLINGENESYFKEPGNYELIIDLEDFSIEVRVIAE